MSGPDSASVREWTDILRRIRFGKTVKVSEKVAVSGEKVVAVARVLATYADADGSRVYPGVPRVAVDARVDYTTAKRAMTVLRRLGLIRIVGKRGLADEYQLAIPVDLLDHVEVLTPAQYELEVERIAAANRRRTGAWRTRTEPVRPAATSEEGQAVRVHQTPVPPVENPAVQVRGAPVPKESPESGTGAGRPGTNPGTGACRPAVQVRGAPATHQDLVTRTTHHSRRDLRTDAAVVGQPAPFEDPSDEVVAVVPTQPPDAERTSRARRGAALARRVLAGQVRPDDVAAAYNDHLADVIPIRSRTA